MSITQSTPSAAFSTALVTGGSRGIGRAIAQTLARDGFQVFLTYVNRPEEAEQTVAEIVAANGQARAFALNVGDSAAVADFFAVEIKDKTNLAVLVNNAGITKDGFLVRMKDEDFDKVLAVNLRGAFVCTREAAKIMSRNRKGRIINISSVVGQMGNAGQINYASAKAGLLGLTKSCAKELASRQITVNAVAPGFIGTPSTYAALQDVHIRHIVGSTPLRRLGETHEVAQAVCALAENDFINGVVLDVNGGLSF